MKNIDHYIKKIQETEQRINYQLEIQRNRLNSPKPYGAAGGKLPNIIVNNNTFNGNVSEMDLNRVIASDDPNQVSYNGGYQSYDGYQDPNQYYDPNYGYGYDSYNQYDNYNYSGYDQNGGYDYYNPYGGEYGDSNYQDYYQPAYGHGSNNIDAAEAIERGYDTEVSDEDVQSLSPEDFVSENQYNNLDEVVTTNFENLGDVGTWNIDSALKNNLIEPYRVVGNRPISNKKLYVRLVLFYSKLISLFEASNSLDHSIYRQAKRDIVTLSNTTTDKELENVLVKAKNILAFLTKIDIQFVDFMETQVTSEDIKAAGVQEDIDLIKRFIVKYKNLIRRWDVLGSQEIINRLYEMALSYDTILKKVTTLMIQRVAASHISEIEKDSIMSTLKNTLKSQDTSALKEVIIEANRKIVSDYRR